VFRRAVGVTGQTNQAPKLVRGIPVKRESYAEFVRWLEVHSDSLFLKA